jgi:hypothetical protein
MDASSLRPTGIAFKAIAQGLLDARDEAIAALVAIERGRSAHSNLAALLLSIERSFTRPAKFTKNWFLAVQCGQPTAILFSS